MKFSLKIGKPEDLPAEGLAIFAWEGEINELPEPFAKFTQKADFKGKSGEILVAPPGELPFEKVFLVGLGKKEEFGGGALRKISASLGKRAGGEACQTLVFSLTTLAEKKDLSLFTLAWGVVEGFLLGSYKFLKYKSDEEKKKEPEVIIFVKDARELVATKEGITRGEIFSQAAIFARDLVNEPASVTTPTYLATVAEKLANAYELSGKIYDQKELQKLGMGALLGVARGADEQPKLIKLEYKGGKKKVVLLGKGITFDTGGLSLKKQEEMETMKMDMAGAAVILGIFSAVTKLRPKVHLVGLIPATENMPSGKALKPGDIVRAYNGKTIEVVNTDAEGRLILADALSFGNSLKPDLMIDLATLTGACIVALGEEIAGLFSHEEKLVEELEEAADKVGEKFWRMPLEKDYKELLKSEIADLKNVSGKKYGGAITAALFLQEFVDKTPWVHLDIAGPAWQEKGTDLIPRGGTGFGVRTILNFLENF